jgi:hypothetical protein
MTSDTLTVRSLGLYTNTKTHSTYVYDTRSLPEGKVTVTSLLRYVARYFFLVNTNKNVTFEKSTLLFVN